MFLLLPLPASGQITGAWNPESYFLKDGTEYSLSGLIFFTESDWTVLFFVEDEEGNGDGGTYTLEGDRLTFTHHYNLSAGDAVGSLAASPLRTSYKLAIKRRYRFSRPIDCQKVNS